MLLKPNDLLKTIMMAEANFPLGSPSCAVSQYLGAAYLAQAFLMARALRSATSTKADLQAGAVFQGLLCLTSLGRLAAGVAPNAVSLSLPVGQGLMATLCFLGHRKA